MKARSSSEDLEANALTISGGRRKKTVHACLLLASALAVTALLSSAVGFVTGLGVIRSEESLFDGCSADISDVDDVESPAVSSYACIHARRSCGIIHSHYVLCIAS